jgi:hypothetical protein
MRVVDGMRWKVWVRMPSLYQLPVGYGLGVYDPVPRTELLAELEELLLEELEVLLLEPELPDFVQDDVCHLPVPWIEELEVMTGLLLVEVVVVVIPTDGGATGVLVGPVTTIVLT